MAFGLAGGGGGKKDPLPAGRYLAQVTDWVEKDFPAFDDPTKTTRRIVWSLDIKAQGSNQWQQHTIFTGTNFTNPKTAKDPQFISGLTKLVDAMGLDIPITQADLEAFGQVELIGLRFIIDIKMDRLTGKLTQTLERCKAGPKVQAAPADPEPEPERQLVAAGAGRAVDGDDEDWDQ